jgi:hypothetical protein
MSLKPLLLILVATVGSPVATAGDVVKVKPGLWESTMTMESSFMPGMPPQTTRECIRESTYDIRKLMDGQGDCRITGTSSEGSTLRWQLACDMDGQSMTGQGQMTSHGDRLEGYMTMNMSFQGQSMDMKTSWKGKRVGDC